MAFSNSYLVIGLVAVAVIVLGAVALGFTNPVSTGNYDEFAKCLSSKGVVMYGAWWCPHCKEQKEDFGASWDILKEAGGYVECSTSDQNVQTQVCRDAGITSYPTWRFADGSEMKGRQTFFTLGNKTGCLEDLQPLQSN